MKNWSLEEFSGSHILLTHKYGQITNGTLNAESTTYRTKPSVSCIYEYNKIQFVFAFDFLFSHFVDWLNLLYSKRKFLYSDVPFSIRLQSLSSFKMNTSHSSNLSKTWHVDADGYRSKIIYRRRYVNWRCEILIGSLII